MNYAAHAANEMFRWVLQTTWQASVLASLILLAQWLLRKRLSPSWRYGLWFLLLVRLLMPFAPQSAASIFNLARNAPAADRSIRSAGAVVAEDIGNDAVERHAQDAVRRNNLVENPHATHSPQTSKRGSNLNWFVLALSMWLAGVCFFGAQLIWTNARFLLRIAAREPIADEHVIRLFGGCRAALKVTRAVRLVESPEVQSPSVYGFRRLWLLLPEGFPERFSTEELRCIFMHELAHIKRGDLGVNWLVSVLRVVHWFNPILWLAWARMRADREMATDALVLSHGAEIERIAYGETILKIVENFAQRTAQPGLVGVAEGKAGLRERLLAISTFGRVRVWRWAAVVVAIIVAWVGMTSAEQTDPPQVAAKAQLTEISGRVLDSSGRPVGGVQLGIVRPLVGHQSGIADPGIGKARLFDPKIPHLVGEPRLENEPWSFCTTDTQGRFYLNDFAGSGRLLAAHETGYADVPTNSFSTNMTITLEPWGKIEGTLWRNDRRISDGSVSIGYTFSTFDNMVRKFNPIPSSMESVWYPDTANSTSGTSFGAITDDSGHYAFDFVRPGQYEIFATGVRERVTVNANETTVADIGGKGRPVIGQFRIRNPYVKINWEDSWDSAFGFCYFATEPAKPAEPFKSREQHMAWRRALEADRGLDNSERGYHVMIAKDGSFSIERVEPGTYALELYLFDPRHRLSNSRDFPAYLGTNVFGQYDGYDRTFEVPANKTNPSEPLDLGVIEISLKE